MALVVLGDLVVAGQRAGQHEPDPALLEHVRDAVADAGLEPLVGGLNEAVGVGVVVGRLGGVADVELEVVDAVNWHHVGVGGLLGGESFGGRSHACNDPRVAEPSQDRNVASR